MLGEWAGRLKDSSGEFEYQLKLVDEKLGVYTGVSTSRSANFYCETRVKAVERNGRLIVSEIEVLKTDFPDKRALCLLKLDLSITDIKLSGDFVPLNNNTDCLSGSVSLIKKTSLPSKGRVVNTQRPVKRDYSPTLAVKNSAAGVKDPIVSIVSKNESSTTRPVVVPRVEKKLRFIDIDEDEVALSILDNMAVDGDMITLMDNDNVIFRKVTLTKTPISYKINNLQSSVHLIKFYAENLGATPPNTGVLIIKTGKSIIKTDFTSDFSQTATIQINLKKAL